MTIYVHAFDIDGTLAANETLLSRDTVFHPHLRQIEYFMAMAIQKGHEVWLVTAHHLYHRHHTQKFFSLPFVFNQVPFFNGYHIADALGVPRHRVSDVHDQGLKGAFLKGLLEKKALESGEDVECVLYDDTIAQIQGVNRQPPSARVRLHAILIEDFTRHRGGMGFVPGDSLADRFYRTMMVMPARAFTHFPPLMPTWQNPTSPFL